ncbi:hypothetical protein [Altericroceibacterium endophyticum]|uniref:Uncharacterized protein n=1 Tax=Altericroceibacterium endophyticum TaxID=1808508 RepID=A0A6I4T745_9SPHN|nr:hypothetical protein [Altericroceibacterium endophyticum]MXO66667.1 hypothetical protein [Altericroceibacterium endophyticum]
MQDEFVASDWISPNEAVEVLEPRYGANTKEFIADKLKDGLIDCHADLAWESSDKSLDAAWKNREETLKDEEEAEVERNIELDSAVWRSSRHWSWDLDYWRWPEGRFVATQSKKPASRTIVEGVKFKKKDILNLSKPPSKRGRKPKYAGWAILFEDMLKLERNALLNEEKFPNKASLEKYLTDCTAAAGELNSLDDETIRRFAHEAWGRVIASN